MQTCIRRTALVTRHVWRTQIENQKRVPLVIIDALDGSACENVKPVTNSIREQYANSTDRREVMADSSYTANLVPLRWVCAANGIRAAEQELTKRGAKQ